MAEFEKRKYIGTVKSPRKVRRSDKARRITAARVKTTPVQTGPARNQLLWLGLVLLATLAAYLPVLRAGFTNYDDGLYILENPMIRNLDWGHLQDIFSTIYQNQYAPIATLIIAIQVKVFGVRPAPLKAVADLLHIANTLL